MNSASIKLRKCRFADLGPILEIERSCFSAEEAYSKSRFENRYRAYRNNFWVAERADKIAGYIVACGKGKSVNLDSLAVARKYRNLGIGSRMLRMVVRRLKNKGIKRISLTVKTSNKKAIYLYKKMGFEIVEMIRNHYRNGCDAYKMEKSLSR